MKINECNNDCKSSTSADEILRDSDLLIKEDCKVYEDLVFEKINQEDHKYRVFIDVDDYDYVEDEELIKKLDNEIFI